MLFIRNLIRRVNRYKDDHEAVFFFTKTCEYINKWGYPVGLSILEENFTPVNPRLIFLVIFNTAFVFFNIYSVYVRRSLDIVEISMSCVPFGLALQGLVKQATFYMNYKELKDMVNSGAEFYHLVLYEKMKKAARDFIFFANMIIMHFVRYAYIIAVALTFFIPIIYSCLFGETRTLPFEVEIPFTDIQNNWGHYWLNFWYQAMSCIYVTIGLVACDGTYIVLLTNAFTQLENIYFELENLDILTQHRNVEKQSKAISEKLNHIIGLHQEYLKFISSVNKMFLWLFTVNIVSMVFQIVISLFITVSANTKISAPIFTLLGTSQLLLCCLVGTLLENKHDKLVLCTYDICWYNMRIQEQKKLLLLLHATQRKVVIEYRFGAMNIPLFVEIYKKIYSGLTMLMQKRNIDGN
ncbi:putative odorant receptor 83c [Culicoides brevitarsis]|uniref:putative odorant receptor 83c n=1 Tax=Culicoides brevitarsis TaxID=469753 RepID=UPI00307C0E3E